MADCKSFISAGIAGAVCALGFGFAALPPFAQELSLDGPNAFRLHREGLNSSEIAHFNYGRGLFHHVWEPVVHDDGTVSGFGPLYNANACAACHVRDGRGQPPRPGDATSFVMRLSVGTREVAGFKHVLPDPVYGYQLQDHAIQGLYPEGRILVTYREFEMALADGQTVRLQRPEYALADPAYGPFDAALKLGPRVAPPVIGLGLLERIPVRRLEALADAFDRDGDGISGRINWSPVDADGQRVPNRFGWKLTAASVREQSEMAANADMGISSPGANRFAGDCTRAQSVCMNMVRPEHFGKDVELDGNEMHLLAFYAANLGVPPRRNIG
ncbi:MAG TPA: thiol oxidoreductase, partial [Devosia sp.]|nr:thiol oxidoreductase [Devosia sp.]